MLRVRDGTFQVGRCVRNEVGQGLGLVGGVQLVYENKRKHAYLVGTKLAAEDELLSVLWKEDHENLDH